MKPRGSATQRSFEQLLAVRPVLSRIAPLADLVPDLPARTLLHAGPPFATPGDMPKPLANSVAAAALLERLDR